MTCHEFQFAIFWRKCQNYILLINKIIIYHHHLLIGWRGAIQDSLLTVSCIQDPVMITRNNTGPLRPMFQQSYVRTNLATSGTIYNNKSIRYRRNDIDQKTVKWRTTDYKTRHEFSVSVWTVNEQRYFNGFWLNWWSLLQTADFSLFANMNKFVQDVRILDHFLSDLRN